MENATRHMMNLEDSQAAKKSCERSSFNIGFAVCRELLGMETSRRLSSGRHLEFSRPEVCRVDSSTTRRRLHFGWIDWIEKPYRGKGEELPVTAQELH